MLTRNTAKVYREINTISTVIAKEITIYLKSPTRAIIMMGMIGSNLVDNMSDGLNFEFSQFMLVGILVNMLFIMTSIAITSLVDEHDSNFKQKIIVSPVSCYSFVVGKILEATFGTIVSMILTLVTGMFIGITLSLQQLLSILLLSPLLCLSGGALTMIMISLIKNKKVANISVILISLFQMFLSGTIIPITNSGGILVIINRIMPMTYCLDLVRAVIYTGSSGYSNVVMFNPFISFIVITLIIIVCLLIGTHLFFHSENNK